MGFYLRKSISFGPVRLNLSKSGIGYSVGVRGARVGTGPRGSYVHVGLGGIYYRQRLGAKHSRLPVEHVPAAPSQQLPGHALPDAIPTADIHDLVDSSAEETLAMLNGCVRRRALTPWIASATVLLAIWLGFGGFVVGLICTVAAYVVDRRRRTARLVYDLDAQGNEFFAACRDACHLLTDSDRLWRIETHRTTADWKRNGGANGLITRSRASIVDAAPPRIETNVRPAMIELGSMSLLFMPDRLFIYQQGGYGAVPYDQLQVDCSISQFREEERVPRDAQVIGSTWRFVNKNGTPDRRFSNNRQIPIAAYGQLDLRSPSGLHVCLNTSDAAVATAFEEAVGRLRTSRRHGGPQKATVSEVPASQMRLPGTMRYCKQCGRERGPEEVFCPVDGKRHDT